MMTKVECAKIIDRLKSACTFNRFDESAVYAEYMRAMIKFKHELMDKAVDITLEEDSRNVPAISALAKAYKKLNANAKTSIHDIENEQYCEVCGDKGFVMMTEITDGFPYQYPLHCPFCNIGIEKWGFLPPLTKYFDGSVISNFRRRNRDMRQCKQSGEGMDQEKIDEIKAAFQKVGMKVPNLKPYSDADDSAFYERKYYDDQGELPF